MQFGIGIFPYDRFRGPDEIIDVARVPAGSAIP